MKVKITVLLLCIIFLTSCSNYNYIEETNNSNSSITNNLPIVEQEEKSLPKPAEKNNESEIIEFNPEEVLADAEPYLNEIVTENQELRKLAVQISTNCSDKECRAVEIFDYVITNYNYIDDPRGSEYIQSPFQTMEIGGGDCEDFTILINSLMENVGIETKLVLTENHAYSLICGLDVDIINQYVANKLINTTWDEYYDNILYYNFDGMKCIVADGANGYYLGDDASIEANKRTVIDPITLKIDFLK